MKKWTVEISVTDNWVEDGFNLDAFSLKNAILSEMLPYAFPAEVVVKINSVK